MYEIRAEGGATVLRLVIDEGQMVAEGDPIVVLELGGAEQPVTTDVPGVVRELHVEPGSRVEAGDLIAMIDES